MSVYNIFLDRLPKIDLHGYDRETSRVMVNDFLNESIVMDYAIVIIIHGVGDGILKRTVHDTLSKRKDVLKYYVAPENIGCTVVELKREV